MGTIFGIYKAKDPQAELAGNFTLDDVLRVRFAWVGGQHALRQDLCRCFELRVQLQSGMAHGLESSAAQDGRFLTLCPGCLCSRALRWWPPATACTVSPCLWPLTCCPAEMRWSVAFAVLLVFAPSQWNPPLPPPAPTQAPWPT